MLKISANKLLLICILFFPVSTILQGLPLFDSINKVLIAVIVFLLTASFFLNKISPLSLILVAITIPLSILGIYYTKGEVYSINTYIYFPFWVLFFLYLKNNYKELIENLHKNMHLVKFNIIFWNILVLVSFFFDRSYTNNWGSRYFRSFSNAEHRFASSCLFILALIWIYIQETKNKKYFILTLLPLLGFLLCGARTYVVVALVFVISIYYTLCKKKKNFYISIIPIVALLTVIILLSPIGDKIITSLKGGGYYGYWATVTNGRNIFWASDMDAYNNLSLWQKLVGNGANFVYDVNFSAGHGRIWAHNDVINLLLSNGIMGALLYLISFFYFTTCYLKKKYNVPAILKLCFYFIWFFNAMLNMVYTYTCMVLATPFILYSICHLPAKKNLEGIISK